MQPLRWQPPVAFSIQEEQIVRRIRKAKLFVFLRQYRHILFDEPFQEELANLYRKEERGRPPVAPAMLALALILEAYTGVSDDEVIEATMMDRRWQLVLDCVDTEEAPISLGTLVAFRRRLIEGQMDRRLIERTIEIAAQSQAFGSNWWICSKHVRRITSTWVGSKTHCGGPLAVPSGNSPGDSSRSPNRNSRTCILRHRSST